MIGETSFLIGDIRTSQDVVPSLTKAEEFLFELAELMDRYQVVKVDVCFDAFAYHKSKSQKS